MQMCLVLTILSRVNHSFYAKGSLSFAVESFDFDVEWCHWRHAGVFVDVPLAFRISYFHPFPFFLVLRFEG